MVDGVIAPGLALADMNMNGVRFRISTFPAFHAAQGCTSLRMASPFSRSARMNS